MCHDDKEAPACGRKGNNRKISLTQIWKTQIIPSKSYQSKQAL